MIFLLYKPHSSTFPSFLLYKWQSKYYDFLLYKPPLMAAHFLFHLFTFHAGADTSKYPFGESCVIINSFIRLLTASSDFSESTGLNNNLA
jgi:hypothetical protein